jgi:hypothetical protein
MRNNVFRNALQPIATRMPKPVQEYEILRVTADIPAEASVIRQEEK